MCGNRCLSSMLRPSLTHSHSLLPPPSPYSFPSVLNYPLPSLHSPLSSLCSGKLYRGADFVEERHRHRYEVHTYTHKCVWGWGGGGVIFRSSCYTFPVMCCVLCWQWEDWCSTEVRTYVCTCIIMLRCLMTRSDRSELTQSMLLFCSSSVAWMCAFMFVRTCCEGTCESVWVCRGLPCGRVTLCKRVCLHSMLVRCVNLLHSWLSCIERCP